MYPIPAPVIKTILDHCDLSSAVILARVTKRCSTIFRQYREEILIRGEYVNVSNMFRYCTDEFIITMSRHEFFDKEEARIYCRQKRYKLHEKLGYGKLDWQDIDKELLREIYINGDYNNLKNCDHKWVAAKMGIELDIPYLDDSNGLHIAILLQNEEMINALQHRGDFYTYCVVGNYHLADKYDMKWIITTINDSNNPLATFEYIEKRGHKFDEFDYFMIRSYDLLKLVMPRITQANDCYVETSDFNALLLICNTLLKFTTIDKIFGMVVYKNRDFTRYLLKNYEHLKNSPIINNLRTPYMLHVMDLLDREKVMRFACDRNKYHIMRTLIRRNGRQWARRYKHPFIEKYYS